MSFSYAVPLSVFGGLFTATDKSLHPELSERLRVEIHADLARRVSGPSLTTGMGPSSTSFDSAETGGDLVFYGDGIEGPSSTLTAAPRTGTRNVAQGLKQVTNDTWRYPGDGGNGLFAASVNAVLARSTQLKREFERRGQQLRSGGRHG